MRRFHLLLMLALSVGCASAATTGKGRPRAPEVKVVRMPIEVAEYAMAEVVRYPDPRAGVLYRYRGDGLLKPDVYLYPAGETLADEDSPRARVETESKHFPQALEVNRQRGRHLAVEILSDSAFVLGASHRGAVGWHTTAHLQQSDGPYESHQHLFTFSDQLVKVRITYPAGAISAATVESFVQGLVLGILREAGYE